MTVIRPAELADIDTVARIWHAGWRDGHLGHVPDALLRHRTYETFPPRVADRLGQTWVAEDAGGVVGFVVVIGDEVEQVYVAATARGTGIAGELLGRAEVEVREAGHRTAWLAVVAGNSRARRFYERCGWTDSGPLTYQAETATGSVAVPCRRYEKVLSAVEPGFHGSASGPSWG